MTIGCFRGRKKNKSLLRLSYPDISLGMRDFVKENITSQMTKGDIANEIASTMTNNRAMVYEMNMSKGFAHATAITRVKIYDNGRILINLMNPSGVGGYRLYNFENMRNIYSIYKFKF
jgi:hypothetical protein